MLPPVKLRHLALPVLLLVACSVGCGSYAARRIAQAPNTYPSWLAPDARVLLVFEERMLTNFPAQFAEVGPPAARLHYRVVEPAEYHFEVASTNWMANGKGKYQFNFRADVPGETNAWTTAPRGTVLLLHGYALAKFAMAPWGLQLAQEGWRSVLVDLRGHGHSTGDRIYFGIQESPDLSQLLDTLERRGELAHPVAVVGESYGAALALRLKSNDPRIDGVVAMAPYAVLSNAVLNICREYAPCLPLAFPKAGLKRLPEILDVPSGELDTTTILARQPVKALFIATDGDEIIPLTDVRLLSEMAAPGSKLIVVPAATHESLPYYFGDLAQPVLEWLEATVPQPQRSDPQ